MLTNSVSDFQGLGLFFVLLVCFFSFNILPTHCLGEVAVLQLMDNFVHVSILEADSALVWYTVTSVNESFLHTLKFIRCGVEEAAGQKIKS